MKWSILLISLILPLLAGCVQVFEQMPHNKWGFIDKTGQLVIPAKFDDVERDQYGGRTIYHKPFRNFSEGLCAVRLGTKWGFIDKRGNFVIEPKYDNAGAFSEGAACVRLGTKYGYIDKTGKEVIPMTFDWPSHSSQVSSNNPDWDFSKNLIEPLIFSEGLAVGRKGDLCGYIDHSGKFVIEPTFMAAQPFDNGYANVTSRNGVAIIDKLGITPFPDQHCISFGDGLFLAHNGLYEPDKRRLFYLNKDGQKAFPADFADARVFSGGFAAVAPTFSQPLGQDSYGYIDTAGKLVITPQFHISGNNLAGDFVNGRAIVSKISVGPLGNIDNLHGVIDSTGHFIVAPQYQHISSYCDGLARAIKNDKFVFLDGNGLEKIQTGRSWANSFSEGLAAVME